MTDARKRFVRNLYLASWLTVATFAAMVSFILWLLFRSTGGFSPGEVILVSALVILLVGVFVGGFAVNWFVREVLRPTGNAAVIAGRVATGDLTVQTVATDLASQNELTRAIDAMVAELRTLVSTILTNAQDAAAMAQQISSATEEMSASTQEVSGTCNDLTERATRQAALVRAAADDASRILAIAESLAESAVEAAERNATLARIAREHREELDASSAELARLEEEIAKGAEEAAALAQASSQIEEFVAQTKAIARQTHILSINAGIEAARAGEEARGFGVVADEVKKLAAQAGATASATSDIVVAVQDRVRAARERLLRLGRGGQAARATAHKGAEGLARVAAEAEQNDAWTRQISRSAAEVRGLIHTIVERMGEISTGTEDVAAAAQEIAASAQELSASTQEIASSAHDMAAASERLTHTVSRFKLGEPREESVAVGSGG